jgi:tetratricopeptide (TPR) repeat protein
LGAAYTLAGRVAEDVPLLMQAIEQTVVRAMVEQQVSCGLSLVEAQMLAGRLEEAYTLAEQTLALGCAHHERGHQAYALRLLGDIAARRDSLDVEPGEEYYRQALALADELGMGPLEAHCHRGLGTLYLKMGRGDEAHIELSTAIELYKAMDMTFWLPQAEAALAQVEGR